MNGRMIEIVIITNQESIIINEPHINVNVQKNINPTQNKATINIWGLNDNTRRKFEAKQNVIIKAGYRDEGGPQVCFRGEITDEYTNKDKPEVITTIDCKSGVKNIRNKFVSRSYNEGVKLRTIIDDIVNITGYAFTTNLDNVTFNNIEFKTGFSYSGEIRGFLNKAVVEIGKLKWNINDDHLKIFNEDQPETETFYYLNSNNGIYGTPKHLTIKDDKKNKTLKGWEVRSRLLAGIEPNSELGLSFSEIPEGSLFSVRNITHELDNEESSFDTTLEAISVK